MRLAFLADENFNGVVLRAFLDRMPSLDVVRAQDVGLARADDPGVLEWAARNGRILLTHDVRTMTRHAIERVRAGRPMPGVVEVGRPLSVGQTVEQIRLM